MAEVRLIEVREEILAENRQEAGDIRAELLRRGIFMLNLMSSPGSGKTSLILRTIRALKDAYRIAVIEGDIDAMVDAEKVAREGIPAVQIRTGGACHLDAPMIAAALKELDLAALDCIIIENVGNLRIRYRRLAKGRDPERPRGGRQAAQVSADLFRQRSSGDQQD